MWVLKREYLGKREPKQVQKPLGPHLFGIFEDWQGGQYNLIGVGEGWKLKKMKSEK